MNLAEAKRAVIPFLKSKISTIAVYGIGSGIHFDALKEWLDQDPNHQLVFFEDDPTVIKKGYSKLLLNHPQVHISQLHDHEAHAILSPDFYFLPHADYQEKAENVYPFLLQEVYSVHAYLAELWHFKEQTNIYYHLAHLDEYVASKKIENHFRKSKCIVCGAGPSLESHLELLKHKKGILIASGTALNILNDHGVQADLGVAFDSKLTGARRLQSNSAFSTPFLVDLDSTDGVRYLSGQKILTKQAKLAAWKDKLLSMLGISNQLIEIGPSISSTHYAIESAIKLGVYEIMLIGVDLAYLKGQQYAGAKTWLLDEEDQVPINERKDLIPLNESLLVSRLFFKEAEMFSNLSFNHPEVNFYDGSNQGQKIAGIPFKDLGLWEDAEQETINNETHFSIPLQEVKRVLLEWKKELQNNPILLLEGYLKRLKLKFAAKERFIGKHIIEQQIKQFNETVVHYHLEKIEEALQDIEDKLTFPDKDGPVDENVLDGAVKLYYNNGQLKSYIDYVKGKRHGLYRFYARTGMLLEEGHYQQGFPIGQYKQWNRKGYLEKEIFSHPKGIFDLTEWDRDGNIIREVKSGHLFKNEVDPLKLSLDGLLKEL